MAGSSVSARLWDAQHLALARAVFSELMGYLNVPSFVKLHKGEVQVRHDPDLPYLRPSFTEWTAYVQSLPLVSWGPPRINPSPVWMWQGCTEGQVPHLQESLCLEPNTSKMAVSMGSKPWTHVTLLKNNWQHLIWERIYETATWAMGWHGKPPCPRGEALKSWFCMFSLILGELCHLLASFSPL